MMFGVSLCSRAWMLVTLMLGIACSAPIVTNAPAPGSAVPPRSSVVDEAWPVIEVGGLPFDTLLRLAVPPRAGLGQTLSMQGTCILGGAPLKDASISLSRNFGPLPRSFDAIEQVTSDGHLVASIDVPANALPGTYTVFGNCSVTDAVYILDSAQQVELVAGTVTAPPPELDLKPHSVGGTVRVGFAVRSVSSAPHPGDAVSGEGLCIRGPTTSQPSLAGVEYYVYLVDEALTVREIGHDAFTDESGRFHFLGEIPANQPPGNYWINVACTNESCKSGFCIGPKLPIAVATRPH